MIKDAKTLIEGHTKRYTSRALGEHAVLKIKKLARYRTRELKFGFVPEMSTELPVICAGTMSHFVAGVWRRMYGHKNENTGEYEPLPIVAEGLRNPQTEEQHEIKDIMTKYLQDVYQYAEEELVATNQHRPVSGEEYCSSMPPSKQKLYFAILPTALRLDISDVSQFDVEAKIKAEKKPVKADLIARVYGAYSTKINICTGRYLKPIEHPIFHGINKTFQRLTGGHPLTVLKGLNSAEKAEVVANKFHSFSKPIAIELDCTHFDKHINTYLLRWEHRLYKMFYSGSERQILSQLLKRQLTTRWKGRTEDGYAIEARTRGGRVSGSVNTALGNIVVMTFVFYQYALILKELGIRFEYVNEGDDCFFIIEQAQRQQLPDITQFYSLFGLNLRIENEVTVLQKISFCQTSPMFINGRWMMIRPPKTVLFKDMCQLVWTDMETYKTWLNQVGTGGSILNAGVPVLSHLYAKMLEWGGEGKPLPKSLQDDMYYSGLFNLCRGLTKNVDVISDDNRFEFYLSTGIRPNEQISIEEYICGSKMIGLSSLEFTSFVFGLASLVRMV